MYYKHIMETKEYKYAKYIYSQVINGAIFLGIGTILYTFCYFILRYVLIRTWSPENYGIFTLIYAIAGILGTLTEFNLNQTTTIFISKNNTKIEANNKTLWSIVLSFIILVITNISISFIILYALNLNITIMGIFRQYYLLIWILVISTGITSIGYGYIRAYKRFYSEALSKTISAFALLFLLLFIVYVTHLSDMALIIILLILSQIFAFLIIMALNKDMMGISLKNLEIINMYNNIKNKIKMSDISSVLIFSFYMSGIGMLFTVLSSIDQLMIPSLISTEMLGYYSGAIFIVSIPKIFSSIYAIILTTTFPQKSSNIKKAKKEYFAFLLLFIIIDIIIYFGFIIFSNEFLILLPNNYNWVSGLVRILLIGMLFSDIFTLNVTFTTCLQKGNVLRRLMFILIIIILLNTILNYILIPDFGLWGAALVKDISYIIIGIISFIFIIKI